MTPCSQSHAAPMLRNWRDIFSMLDIVQARGLMLFLIAAFSAGRPKASNPMGWKTLNPCIRL
jgi:hypothetical protein